VGETVGTALAYQEDADLEGDPRDPDTGQAP